MKVQLWRVVYGAVFMACFWGCSRAGSIANAPDDGSDKSVLTSSAARSGLAQGGGGGYGPVMLEFFEERVSVPAAELLASVKGSIHLHGVTALSRDEATALARHAGMGRSPGNSGMLFYQDELSLPGLNSLSTSVAEALASRRSGALKIGVKEPLSNAAAAALAKYSGRNLWIESAELSASAQDALAKCPASVTLTGGPKTFTSPALAEKLCASGPPDRLFIWSEEITTGALKALCKNARVRELVFSKLNKITAEQAEVLKQYSGSLRISFPKSLIESSAPNVRATLEAIQGS